MNDNVDEADSGPRVQMISSNEIKLLYTSLFGFNTSFDLISVAFSIFLIIFGIIAYLNSGKFLSIKQLTN